MSNSDPDTRRAHWASNPAMKLLIAAAVVLLVILGVYYWGNAQTRSQLAAQQTDYEQRIGTTQQQLQATRNELATARNRNQLLMARTDLYRAAADLDQRNFGTANTRLQEAAAALGRVDSSVGGIDTADFAQLRSAIAITNVNVATNLQDQRNLVLNLAARLDEIALQESAAAPLQ
ncbi:MAG: hypothetical protein M3Q40_09610 [Pseudomonadota bacterium]|nr:hypothetical protein [Pseudomonadota bacterium]